MEEVANKVGVRTKFTVANRRAAACNKTFISKNKNRE